MTFQRLTIRCWPVAALIAMAAVTGCGASGGSSAASSGAVATQSAAPTMSPAAPPSTAPASVPASPSAAASASAAAGDLGKLCAKEYEGCSIAAGAYAADPFTPAFTFEVEGDWVNDRAWPDGGGVSFPTGGLYWGSGMKSGRQNDKDVTFDSTIEGFAAYLRDFKGWKVTDADPVTIDGVTAVALDVATGDADGSGMYFVAKDQFNLVPGEKARFLLLERDGTLVTFVIDAYKEADFDAVLARIQPVLDSVRWT